MAMTTVPVLLTGGDDQTERTGDAAPRHQAQSPPRAVRHRLPDERKSVTHKFGIAGHEGYLTVGVYPDNQPGELFIVMSKEGSTLAGLMNSFAQAISIALQHGVPLKLLCDKFSHTRFEPSGWTGNPEIPYANSVMDYIFRWLGLRFLAAPPLLNLPAPIPAASPNPAGNSNGNGAGHRNDPSDALRHLVDLSDAPSCITCGAITVRSGSCYRCLTCGSTTGCG